MIFKKRVLTLIVLCMSYGNGLAQPKKVNAAAQEQNHPLETRSQEDDQGWTKEKAEEVLADLTKCLEEASKTIADVAHKFRFNLTQDLWGSPSLDNLNSLYTCNIAQLSPLDFQDYIANHLLKIASVKQALEEVKGDYTTALDKFASLDTEELEKYIPQFEVAYLKIAKEAKELGKKHQKVAQYECGIEKTTNIFNHITRHVHFRARPDFQSHIRFPYLKEHMVGGYFQWALNPRLVDLEGEEKAAAKKEFEDRFSNNFVNYLKKIVYKNCILPSKEYKKSQTNPSIIKNKFDNWLKSLKRGPLSLFAPFVHENKQELISLLQTEVKKSSSFEGEALVPNWVEHFKVSAHHHAQKAARTVRKMNESLIDEIRNSFAHLSHHKQQDIVASLSENFFDSEYKDLEECRAFLNNARCIFDTSLTGFSQIKGTKEALISVDFDKEASQERIESIKQALDGFLKNKKNKKCLSLTLLSSYVKNDSEIASVLGGLFDQLPSLKEFKVVSIQGAGLCRVSTPCVGEEVLGTINFHFPKLDYLGFVPSSAESVRHFLDSDTLYYYNQIHTGNKKKDTQEINHLLGHKRYEDPYVISFNHKLNGCEGKELIEKPPFSFLRMKGTSHESELAKKNN